eukprot:TRINITY_DN1326_c0_g1_i1.p1 TRINITY_DN1326_c0_g1~~TRINITY_DN1326_c0_g1_i1.p1  ORF type:complete len:471 (+),score=119.58 TRINITY_DN1326_c0_g1_i1:76-1413(+)
MNGGEEGPPAPVRRRKKKRARKGTQGQEVNSGKVDSNLIKRYLMDYTRNMNEERYQKALDCLEKAYELCVDGLGKLNPVSVYTHFSFFNVYLKMENLEVAEKVLIKSLKQLKEARSLDKTKCGAIYEGAAILYSKLNNPEKTLGYCDESARAYSIGYTNDPISLGNVYASLAGILHRMGLFQRAAELYTSCLELLSSQDWDGQMISIVVHYSDCLQKIGEEEKAVSLLEESIKKVEQLEKNTNFKSILFKKLGLIHFISGNYEQAEVQRTRALESLASLDNPTEFLSDLADVYWQTGKADLARMKWNQMIDIWKKQNFSKLTQHPLANSKFIKTKSYSLECKETPPNETAEFTLYINFELQRVQDLKTISPQGTHLQITAFKYQTNEGGFARCSSEVSENDKNVGVTLKWNAPKAEAVYCECKVDLLDKESNKILAEHHQLLKIT